MIWPWIFLCYWSGDSKVEALRLSCVSALKFCSSDVSFLWNTVKSGRVSVSFRFLWLIWSSVSLRFRKKEGFDLVKKRRWGCMFLLRDHTEEFLGIGVGVIKASLSSLFSAIHHPAAISVPTRFTLKCLLSLSHFDLHLKLFFSFFKSSASLLWSMFCFHTRAPLQLLSVVFQTLRLIQWPTYIY